MVKLRLQRHGKKGKPFYHIVVAEARAPRDGKFIEKIGSYNPNTNPATILLDQHKAVDWLSKGAQPTYTVRAILKYKGALYLQHLNRGVKKGAFDQEEADRRFAAFIAEKTDKLNAHLAKLAEGKDAAQAAILKKESEISNKRAADIAARTSEVAAAAVAAAAPVEAAAEEVVEAVAEEAAPTPEPVAEVSESITDALEAKEEEKAPEAEAPAAADSEDAPAVEAAAGEEE